MSCPCSILVINPGSTSTKIALYEEERELFSETVNHSTQEMAGFTRISEQEEFRVNLVKQILESKKVDIRKLSAVVGRGGLLKPIPGGTYRVNEKMLLELRKAVGGEHASNLGGIIADDIASSARIPAFIVDPVVVDEMEPVARISGIPELERRSIFHALNQKAVGRKVAEDLGRDYNHIHLIVVHMGGGISVGAHRKGKVIDVNNALDGDGPFSPERAGGLPVGQLVDLCYSGKYQHHEMKKHLVGKGGMIAYTGTHDLRIVKSRMDDGDETAAMVYNAMAYQIAKEIGCAATVLSGKVDGIVMTGGLAYDEDFITLIKQRVDWIASVYLYPGEGEMKALALGALRVLRGEEKDHDYM